jgi:hypothetical protein
VRKVSKNKLISHIDYYLYQLEHEKKESGLLQSVASFFSYSSQRNKQAAIALRDYLEAGSDVTPLVAHISVLNSGKLQELWLLFQSNFALDYAQVLSAKQSMSLQPVCYIPNLHRDTASILHKHRI